jgi:hypothetical protein
MSAIDKRLAAAAKTAIDVISSIAGTSAGTEKAERAVAAIGVIADAVRAGFAREISPAEVVKAIEQGRLSLTEAISSNDANARDRADKKFGPKPTP